MLQTLGDRRRASTRVLRHRTHLPEVPTFSALVFCSFDSYYTPWCSRDILQTSYLEKLMRHQCCNSSHFQHASVKVVPTKRLLPAAEI